MVCLKWQVSFPDDRQHGLTVGKSAVHITQGDIILKSFVYPKTLSQNRKLNARNYLIDEFIETKYILRKEKEEAAEVKTKILFARYYFPSRIVNSSCETNLSFILFEFIVSSFDCTLLV